MTMRDLILIEAHRIARAAKLPDRDYASALSAFDMATLSERPSKELVEEKR